MRLRTLLLGAAAGAGGAYLFDPISGRSRRARLRDQALARVRDMRRRVGSKGRYHLHRLEGRIAETSSIDRVADDAILVERIRSQIFGRVDVPDDRVSLDVHDGIATLRGELDSREEIEGLAARVAGVAGVADVVALMHLPGQPPPNKRAALEASRGVRAGMPVRRSFG
jgi:hyperosmotically inducible protein